MDIQSLNEMQLKMHNVLGRCWSIFYAPLMEISCVRVIVRIFSLFNVALELHKISCILLTGNLFRSFHLIRQNFNLRKRALVSMAKVSKSIVCLIVFFFRTKFLMPFQTVGNLVNVTAQKWSTQCVCVCLMNVYAWIANAFCLLGVFFSLRQKRHQKKSRSLLFSCFFPLLFQG